MRQHGWFRPHVRGLTAISSTTLREGGGWWIPGSQLDLDFANNRAFNRSTGFNGSPNGILTYTSPSPKLVYGDDGVLGYAPHNLILQSQTFDNASWVKTDTTVSADATVAPNGTATADLLTEGSAGTGQVGQTVSIPSGLAFTVSLSLKRGNTDWLRIQVVNVSDFFRLWVNLNTGAIGTAAGGGSGVYISSSITAEADGWYRVSITGRLPATSASLFVNTSSADNSSTRVSGGTYYLWGAQLNLGSSALTYTPTTSAAVYFLPIDHNPTTFEPLGVLIEEQRVNLCLYSDDFTNAAWVKSNLTAAKTATGPDGVANSASTLTATAANATALQAITSTSAARITSMFVKRRTGTGAIEMTQDNGSTWTAVTVTAGWTRVNIASATAANPTVGIRIVTSGDAIDVDLFQHELGAFITSPVPTAASQVTRAADQVSILTSAFALNANEGTVVAEARGGPTFASTAGYRVFSLYGTGTRLLDVYSSSSGQLAYYKSTDAEQKVIGSVVASTAFKLSIAYKLNDYQGAVDGVLGTADTSTGALVSVSTLGVGNYLNGSQLNGHIKRLTYFPTRKSNAELQVLST